MVYFSMQPQYMQIVVGGHDSEVEDGITVDVEALKLHENYTRYAAYDDNDIGIIKLSKTLHLNNNINPICLPNPDRFFDNYWSKYPGTIINIEVNLDYPLLHIHLINNNVNFVALDIIFINLFAKYLNISTIVLAKNESIIHASFVKPSFFLAARSSIQAYNPQTYAATHYILVYYVPKPK